MPSMLWRVSTIVMWAGAAIVIALGAAGGATTRSVAAVPIEPRDDPAQLSASSAFTIGLELVSSGLSSPVHVTHAGDNSGRLFVIEQAGTVRVIKNGALLAAPYLNITPLVSCCFEQGLLSIAFDPDFPATRAFYLNYTNLAGNTVIARYTVADAAADVANVVSSQIILTIDQPEGNHNGGQLQFGPNDDYLYIGMGDGGGAGDQHGPLGNAQNPAELLGKMLRLNVRGVPTYTIPATNPFTQTAGYRPEIWALGLRNPWRFSFDRLNGDLFIGDVGQNCWEEIDYQPGNSAGGQNYGWRQMEGLRPFNVNNFNDCTQTPITPPGLTLPVAVYGRNLGAAVSGGYVYRGQHYPQLQGVYFYADYSYGNLWSLEQTNPGVWTDTLLLDAGFNVSSFGEDQSGELYVTGLNTGGVYRVISAPQVSPPDLTTSTKRASQAAVNPGDTITYSIVLRSTGGPLAASTRVTDTLPAGLNYVAGSFGATLGTVQATPPVLKWTGVISTTPVVTLTYAVTVSAPGPIGLTNTAEIEFDGNSVTRTAAIIVNGVKLYLPVILKL
ncbi:MAG: PQQ-dependent sugar dehydrogenase [Thermoflexales bacterium]|nr:PQQ-dependent sugar dehydrogenase [Thermoflexales bacterium]